MPVDRTNKVHGPSDSTPTPGRRTWEPAPSETQIQSGRSALMLGHQGNAVRRLQELLNRAGAVPKLDVDGKLGPATERAIVRFQRKHDLDDDGMAGRRTWSALKAQTPATAVDDAGTAVTNPGRSATTTPKPLEPERSGVALRPPERTDSRPAVDATGVATEPGRANAGFGRDRATREAQGEAILRANGQWPPVEGHVYLIQIDQDAPPAPTPVAKGLTGTALKDAKRRYNAEKQSVADYLRHYTGEAVVFKGVGGRLLEQDTNGPLRSAAHPGQLSTTSSPDVNRDGQSDIANLRSGVYQYRGRLNGSNRYDPVSDASMKVARDLNHDGVIDESESQRNFTAAGIQLHAGNAGGPSSIGCQTFEPTDYNQLTRAIKGAKVSTFTYVLVRRPNDESGANPF